MDRILDSYMPNTVVILLADACFPLLYKICKFMTSSCKTGQFIEKDEFIERDEEAKMRNHSLKIYNFQLYSSFVVFAEILTRILTQGSVLLLHPS